MLTDFSITRRFGYKKSIKPVANLIDLFIFCPIFAGRRPNYFYFTLTICQYSRARRGREKRSHRIGPENIGFPIKAPWSI